MYSVMEQTIESSRQLVIRQVKEWVEIVVNFETKNKYELYSADGNMLGYIMERDGGLLDSLKRMLLRSHRPLEIDILDRNSQSIFRLSRKFFLFFSDLHIAAKDGQKLGSIHRRFGLIYKKYELHDKYGNTFARISAPIWRLWTFPVLNKSGQPAGVISKKWQGLLKEAFTDADSFVIDFGATAWQFEQKVVILCAAISIDFDFFEENQASRN